MACKEDVQCGANQLCYSNVSWIDDVDLWESEVSGCFCNTFYGFTGYPECEDLTMANYATLMWNLFNALLNILAMMSLYKVFRQLYRNKNLFKWNNVTTTISLASVSSVCTFIWAFVFMLSAMIPGEEIFSLENAYRGKFNSVLWVFAPVAIGTSALSVINIAITWIDIAKATKTFSSAKLNRMKRLVRVYEVAIVISAVAGAIFEKQMNTSAFGFFLTPLVICVLCTYIYGALNLNVTLEKTASATSGLSEQVEFRKESQGTWNSIKKRAGILPKEGRQLVLYSVIRKVRYTAVSVCIGLLTFWFAIFGLSLIDVVYRVNDQPGWKEISPPGEFSPAKTLHHLQISAISFGNVIVGFYFASSISKRNDSEDESSGFRRRSVKRKPLGTHDLVQGEAKEMFEDETKDDTHDTPGSPKHTFENIDQEDDFRK